MAAGTFSPGRPASPSPAKDSAATEAAPTALAATQQRPPKSPRLGLGLWIDPVPGWDLHGAVPGRSAKDDLAV
jgi:hypothetical protein